jgi:hypothetical protein
MIGIQKMKEDINTRGDVNVGNHLYENADPMIGPIFTEVAKVNWASIYR